MALQSPHRKRTRRREIPGGVRFVAFSCHRRHPLLRNAAVCRPFLKARAEFSLEVFAWLLMPEPAHCWLGLPEAEFPCDPPPGDPAGGVGGVQVRWVDERSTDLSEQRSAARNRRHPASIPGGHLKRLFFRTMATPEFVFQMRHIQVRVMAKLRKTLGLPIEQVPFSIYGAESEKSAELAKSVEGDLARIFFSHRGRVVHKWIHYLEAYEHHLSRFRNRPVRMIEIGVSQGGSLEMWRDYFGPDATILGIDIDPECANRVTAPNLVRVGSQDDPEFLRRVVEEMGPPDIILDDGSHVSRHQLASFDTLFPLLSDGGIYAIEDLHTAYWLRFGGGHGRRNTAIGLVKQMIDDLHGWYHPKPMQTLAKEEVRSIHIYDSIVFVEKRKKLPPIHIQIG